MALSLIPSTGGKMFIKLVVFNTVSKCSNQKIHSCHVKMYFKIVSSHR
jgi:hypothetical protein